MSALVQAGHDEIVTQVEVHFSTGKKAVYKLKPGVPCDDTFLNMFHDFLFSVSYAVVAPQDPLLPCPVDTGMEPSSGQPEPGPESASATGTAES